MALTFEQALTKLEEVVKKLENKEINLDEAVKLYNEGLELSKVCYELLKESEKLIVEKMTEAGLEKVEVE
ncbi:MAG: exodeoxyribonuclease VII small subunit [Acholeplasmataceae bacterium]|jgi:exodeoxyribonuclease VII small subunit|nr:exodeoxyribonuclease VII small subunit [Acholeplasmataceae bacterium]